jgi:hypothetical protein
MRHSEEFHMHTAARLLVAASLLISVPARPSFAQAPVDPSGHWTGAIHVPSFNGAGSREVAIEIDLAASAGGVFTGTFSQPDQNVKGLPLSNVSRDGQTVSFEIRTSGGGVFRGTQGDASSISGEFVTTQGGFNIPFDLKRSGEARIAARPKSPQISKDLEGTWNGTIEVGGKTERLVLKMTNESDGTAVGTIQDIDGSNVEIPVAMTQKASSVTIDLAVVGASYSAVLNADNDLVGTWTQGPLNLPVTFKRVSK